MYVSSPQSFPNQDGMRAQLESHVESLEKQADLTALAERADSSSLIDLIVVTDSEAVLGIGGKCDLVKTARTRTRTLDGLTTLRFQTKVWVELPSPSPRPLFTPSELVSNPTESYPSSWTPVPITTFSSATRCTSDGSEAG